MKIYKQDVINLTQQYISELINYNEEVNILECFIQHLMRISIFQS